MPKVHACMPVYQKVRASVHVRMRKEDLVRARSIGKETRRTSTVILSQSDKSIFHVMYECRIGMLTRSSPNHFRKTQFERNM